MIPQINPDDQPDDRRTIVVTGASRGLGRSIAARFAREGARIVVLYRQRDKEAQKTATLVREAGGDPHLVRVDLRDREALDAALKRLKEEIGPTHVLVNNAAHPGEGLFAMQSSDEFDAVLDTDLGGAIRCTRTLVRDMIAARDGVIINISSVMTRRGQLGQVAYTTAKGAIEAFTRGLALELGPRGVRVNAVVAGVFETGMSVSAPRAVRERWVETIPLHRLGDPDDLAAAVCWLASKEASYITGHTLVVDGGLSL